MAKLPRPLVFEIYRAKDGFRIRLLSGNGKILLASQDPYRGRHAARHAVRVVRQLAPDASLRVERDDGTWEQGSSTNGWSSGA